MESSLRCRGGCETTKDAQKNPNLVPTTTALAHIGARTLASNCRQLTCASEVVTGAPRPFRRLGCPVVLLLLFVGQKPLTEHVCNFQLQISIAAYPWHKVSYAVVSGVCQGVLPKCY